jgi:hypothetical protein
MEGTARIWFTPQQRAELWERWKNRRARVVLHATLRASTTRTQSCQRSGTSFAELRLDRILVLALRTFHPKPPGISEPETPRAFGPSVVAASKFGRRT